MKKTAAIIIKNKGKILLEKRLKKPYKNFWSLPGGHVEKKETPLETIKRETKEELNIKISPVYLTSMEERIPSQGWKSELYIFESKSKDIPKADKIEVSEFKWFSKNELKDLRLGFKHKQILDKYL